MQEPVAQRVEKGASEPGASAAVISPRVTYLRRLLLGTGGVFLVWLLLVSSLDPQELLAGILVAVLVALLSLPQLRLLDDIRLTPLLPWHLLRFLLVFAAALLQANLDMARRVLSPRLPIRPGLVEVRLGLSSPLGRLLLANVITLTPGTLSVDIAGDRLLVHWIDVSHGTDSESATHAIVERFESHLRRLLR